MDAVIVRYELDPNRLDEHCKLIEAVFAHLRDERPEGVHYGVLKSARRNPVHAHRDLRVRPGPNGGQRERRLSEPLPRTSERDASCRLTP